MENQSEVQPEIEEIVPDNDPTDPDEKVVDSFLSEYQQYKETNKKEEEEKPKKKPKITKKDLAIKIAEIEKITWTELKDEKTFTDRVNKLKEITTQNLTSYYNKLLQDNTAVIKEINKGNAEKKLEIPIYPTDEVPIKETPDVPNVEPQQTADQNPNTEGGEVQIRTYITDEEIAEYAVDAIKNVDVLAADVAELSVKYLSNDQLRGYGANYRKTTEQTRPIYKRIYYENRDSKVVHVITNPFALLLENHAHVVAQTLTQNKKKDFLSESLQQQQ
jgi:hypothetical protein